jgi:GT2 family glycosyltransferase
VGRSCRRLADHDGRLLTKLIEGSAPPPHPDCEETEFGARLRAPWVSIIVPLYGRADFMEHQLLEFASDADFQAAGVELIYVIDDPGLLDAVRERSQALFNLYRLPFRVIWGGMNRGYAGANNLGASKASAPHLIFLNSDAFPVEPGWARRLVDALVTRNDVAGVGARLLYPDGSVQHLGMKLEFDSYYGVWLNQHPGKGLMPASASPELLEVAAATGACLAVRKEDFEAVEGFDEGYLAGDFEDSDLCLKLTREGRKIVVVADTNIVHLERQSFEGIGSDAIRTNIVLFNAWRHTQRWRKELEGMPQ